jgi:general secretion pathway protein I
MSPTNDCLQSGATVRISCKRNRGFSLLEVIFALAILGGSIAVLGEVSRQALKNAEYTRDMARAQLLCESKLSEIVAGITSSEPTENGTFDSSNDSHGVSWLYSVENTSTREDGVTLICVTVKRDLPAEKHPVHFSLHRWILDTSSASASNQSSASQQNASNAGSSGSSK